jgi:hypothetical protein
MPSLPQQTELSEVLIKINSSYVEFFCQVFGHSDKKAKKHGQVSSHAYII